MIILTDKMLVIPVGISPNYSSENKPSLEDKNVEITENGDYSYTAGPEYYGIGNFNLKVNVQWPVEGEKTVNPSFAEDITVLPSEGFDAMSSVIVKKAVANLEDKNVEINENGDYSFSKSAPYDGIGNFNVKVNVQEKEIRYAIRPTSGSPICPFTNVLLNETSWVSLDFSMDTSSLSKEKAYLFGISASSLHCYLNNGVLHMYTGEEVPMNKQITLDTNKHTLEFGFVSKADASGHAEFEVVFDGEMVADVMVLVPKFNLPLSLFDVPNAYDGTYDDYIAGGGISYLIYNIGYTSVNNSVFDLFALTVYDKPGYYRQTINVYTPSLDAGNKPIFIDNIKGEYQYPINGTYSYVKIDGDTRTEIASATYTMPSSELQYFRPSEGAIVPTDIELPEHHSITMYVKDIEDFTVETDTAHMGDEDKRNIIRKKVMIGAQDEMIAPFNHTDYERNIHGFEVNDDRTAKLADASGGIYYKIDGNDGYSIDTEYGGTPQKLTSFSGEHTIKCGVRMRDTSSIWKSIRIDSKDISIIDTEDESRNLWGGIGPGRLNEFKFAPLCIFGTYTLDESKKPDDVIALGYQDALNQIGYKTGVRYAVKQVDIEELYVDHDGGNTFDNKRLKHRLVTNTDNNGVNCLFDTITGTTYYPYNGTLDLYTGPVEPEPEPPVIPDASILTDTYIKPSAGAIVPTDIKFSAYTIITMDIKDMDNFDEALDSTVTGEAALDVVKSRVMIGAAPNVIAPFNHLDYERRLPELDINDENTRYLGDSSIGLLYRFGPDGGYKRYSIKAGPAHPAIPSLTGEHAIEIGLRTRQDYWMEPHRYFLESSFIIDNQPESSDITYQITYPIEWMNNATKAPICIFGTYNLDESKTPDDVIAMGYQNALNELGYTTGVRFGIKKLEIKQFNYDKILTEKYSLVPARDKDGVICLYDEVNNKSYYSYNGTLDVYTGPVEPEPPVDPEPPVTPDISEILTGTYIKPSAGAIVPTDIKLPTYHSITMYVKDIEDVVTEGVDPGSLPIEEKLNLVRKKVMIGAQGELIAPFDHVDYESNMQFDMPVNEENTAILADASGGIYYKVGGNMTSHNGFSIVTSNGGTPQKLTSFNGEHIIKCGVRMADSNSIWKFISIDSEDEAHQLWNGVSSDRLNNFSYAPLCVFGTYNVDESKKPDDVIALGYENALNQIGYTTGVRYSVKQIDIAELNADGSMTTKHSLVPARDSNGKVLLYDTVSNKSYYPFHGTLDII